MTVSTIFPPPSGGEAGAAHAPSLPGQAPAAPPGARGKPGTPGQAPDAAQVRQAVAEANTQLANKDTQMEFVFDDQVHRTLVKIVDKQTREVVAQIPTESMLGAARALASSKPRGAIVDTQA